MRSSRNMSVRLILLEEIRKRQEDFGKAFLGVILAAWQFNTDNWRNSPKDFILSRFSYHGGGTRRKGTVETLVPFLIQLMKKSEFIGTFLGFQTRKNANEPNTERAGNSESEACE